MKSRLIVCCDGTWQDLGQGYPTNVVKMVQAITPLDDSKGNPIRQIIYYDEGIGTKQSNAEVTDTLIKIAGGALGIGMDHKIEDAYRFLCLNYQPEDEIYLFGFSRGAYTVRCLAGLIYNCGLLYREFIRQIPKAYEIYREKQDPNNAPNGKNAIDFRNQYGRRVPIKALCCWDTVASLGIPDIVHSLHLDEKFNERYRFYDSTINPTIEKAFHAVAIDEIRKVFDVTLIRPHSTHIRQQKEQVVQVWFPGGHGCVGGGSQEESGLSDGALLWMMEQVEALGLALDKSYIQHGVHPNCSARFDNTSKWPFNVAGTAPRQFEGDVSNLHESVKNRWTDLNINPPYKPAIPEIQMMLEQELGALRKKEIVSV